MTNPPLGHVEQLGPNTFAIRHGDVTVLYSYETPVAAALGHGVFVRTDKIHSRTTSKHIGQWLEGRSASKVPQEVIDRLAREGDSSIVTDGDDEVRENPSGDFSEELELAIDETGLDNTLLMLADICDEKADHIRSSYDDEVLARSWTRAADAIRRFVKTTPSVKNVS